MSAAVDLDPESRASLEFDELLAWVASHARTVPGRRRLAARQPIRDAGAARRELAAVDETRRHVQAAGRLVTARTADPQAALDVLAVVGGTLEAVALYELATTGLAVAMLRRQLLLLGTEDYPWLRGTGEALPDLERDCRAIVAAIEPEGHIRDEASPELKKIRHDAARAAAALRRTLERLVRDPAAGTTFREDFITQRNGRYVVPVRSDAPHPLSGIVHASSSSGATQFVEPLETVALNNDLVRLAERERDEERRLLAEWSERLRRRRPEWIEAAAGLAAVDDAQARALFADECGAVSPDLVEEGPIVLEGARHPLLERRLRQSGASAVPFDLRLDPAAQILVVSGPNAGGKTVVLKTLGLTVLMAQAGIPVPARRVRLPCFGQLRVDIGDHQSIQADLSTFSAHVAAVSRFLAGAAPPALFLFDEIGSGTEPSEGGALARAVLEALVGRGITVVATTHLADVKEWAVASTLATSAAMEFDPERLRPTFRLLQGATGVSAGLDIARRAGLPQPIVDRAREQLGPDSARRESYLARLQALVASEEREREALAAARREAALSREALEARLAREQELWQRRAAERLERALGKLAEEGRRELAAIRDLGQRRRAERRFSRNASTLGARAASAVAARSDRPPDDGGAELPVEPRPGLRVQLLRLGRAGEVVEAHGGRVKVRLGEMVVDADRSELRVVPGGPAPDPVSPRSSSPAAFAAAAASPARRELLLVGMTTDEARDALDKFLDTALVAGFDEVRIVHGHGTGKLRAFVREFLAQHAAVASHRAGRPEEGGDGATLATLV